MKYTGILLFVFSMAFALSSCGDTAVDSPKPRIFPKITYPEKGYESFELEGCPFSFDIPTYSIIDREKRFFGEDPLHPCWFDIVIPAFDARIYMSYYPVSSRADLDEFIADSYTIANQINQRSDYMDEYVISKGRLGGIILEFEGHAASPTHFILTDTTNHFLRGALYFNTAVRPDSLAPVIEFLKEDISKLIDSFEWEE